MEKQIDKIRQIVFELSDVTEESNNLDLDDFENITILLNNNITLENWKGKMEQLSLVIIGVIKGYILGKKLYTNKNKGSLNA